MASREHRNGPFRFTEITRSESGLSISWLGKVLYAGIVDQDIEAAELLNRGGAHLLHLVLFRNIGLHNDFAPAPIRTGRPGHDASGIGLLGSASIVDGDVGALAREPHSDCLTDTGGGSGNQNVLAFKTLHAFAPVIPFHVLHPQEASPNMPARRRNFFTGSMGRTVVCTSQGVSFSR
jgi:hypothetical protein